MSKEVILSLKFIQRATIWGGGGGGINYLHHIIMSMLTTRTKTSAQKTTNVGIFCMVCEFHIPLRKILFVCVLKVVSCLKNIHRLQP